MPVDIRRAHVAHYPINRGPLSMTNSKEAWLRHPGWIGVDLDGTLAHYEGWTEHIGEPIPAMVNRVKAWLAKGKEVRIFTARAFTPNGDPIDDQFKKIYAWCYAQFSKPLPITNRKDIHMIELWDDRAVQVIPNIGEPVGR